MTDLELKPCAHCGRPGRTFGAPSWGATCNPGLTDKDTGCGACVDGFDTQAEAIAAWNRRPTDDAALAARGAGQGEADWRSAMRGLIDVWHRQAAAIEKDTTKAVPAADVRLSRVRAALLDRVASDLKLTMACVASPAAGGGWKPEREQVARIIEPESWAVYDQCVQDLDHPYLDQKVVTKGKIESSLERADAILALPAAPSQGEA